MSLEKEIILLTSKWYKYVNLDHHKDRDCHWHITKTYSYGDEAYYEAHHSGYILDHWTSTRCSTEEMASTLLRNKLKHEIDAAIVHLNDALNDDNALEWFGVTKDEVKALIKELQK